MGGNAAGCDSTVTLHLTINHGTHNAETQSTCNTYTWHGNTYSSTGNYVHTYTNASGCTSADTLHLTKSNTTTGTDNQTACETYTWIDGNTYTSSTTTPTHTIVGGNAAGCDSTVTLHLTINHGTHNAETQSATGSYTWHGNTYTATGDYVYSYTNASGCASVDTLHLTMTAIVNGALPGEFSVSSTKKIKFSQGNLQYQASAGIWRFAERQYDYVGDADRGNVYVNSVKSNNANASSTYSGWIDLVGWGTSGYHKPGDTYSTRNRPYETAATTIDISYNYYGYGPSTNKGPHIIGSCAHYDWGVHNPISNGGNAAGMWRTLTKDEWVYLIETRTTTGVVGGTSNARYCKAKVNGVCGLIIFPDSYVHPIGMPVPSNINQSDANFSNTFTSSQWSSMEVAGCAFLPAAGSRSDPAVSNAGTTGSYWSSMCVGSIDAYKFGFSGGFVKPNAFGNRCFGFSVRLVQDVN